jgi:hypothetical protein
MLFVPHPEAGRNGSIGRITEDAVITSSLSTVYVARIVIPEAATVAPVARPQVSLTGLRDAIGKHRPFANIVLNTLVFNLALWMAAPLQPIYFVRTLGANDGWLGLWLGVVSGGAVMSRR